VDVALLHWPAEAERRDQLVARGLPRLLVVATDAIPPSPPDCLEDWTREGTPESDLRVRIAGLECRASEHHQEAPLLDDDGVLRFGEHWVALPPVEARLAGLLVERFGAVVSRESLSRAGWPTTPTGRNALDVHILRLRRRIHNVGLSIRTVRSRGYLMEESAQLARAAAD
jgi:biotin operon repressor